MPTHENIDKVARLAHEANKAYCETLGDNSQPSWEDAPEWQKTSARKGVIFHCLNPQATPQNSHESWLEEKRAEGWKYGPVKDPENKEHPCFVPYNELPPEQQKKDAIFTQIMNENRELLHP